MLEFSARSQINKAQSWHRYPTASNGCAKLVPLFFSTESAKRVRCSRCTNDGNHLERRRQPSLGQVKASPTTALAASMNHLRRLSDTAMTSIKESPGHAILSLANRRVLLLAGKRPRERETMVFSNAMNGQGMAPVNADQGPVEQRRRLGQRRGRQRQR